MMEGVRFKTDWATDAMIDFHLKAMRAQLQQLRSALALAVALNRTLVMPKLVSWCDRYWGPVEFCQLPGAFKMRLPFVAPMDHVLGGWPGAPTCVGRPARCAKAASFAHAAAGLQAIL